MLLLLYHLPFIHSAIHDIHRCWKSILLLLCLGSSLLSLSSCWSTCWWCLPGVMMNHAFIVIWEGMLNIRMQENSFVSQVWSASAECVLIHLLNQTRKQVTTFLSDLYPGKHWISSSYSSFSSFWMSVAHDLCWWWPRDAYSIRRCIK